MRTVVAGLRRETCVEPSAKPLSRGSPPFREPAMTAVYPLSTDGASPTGRIAFIQSSWHKELVDQTLAGFTDEFAKLGYPADLVDRWELPGAFEIPLHA